MQPGLAISLLAAAFLLGLRHGFDFDHVAAIADITGAGVVATVGDDSAWQLNLRAMERSTLYALGHALVLVLLGCAIRSFAGMIPRWIDPVGETLIGLTLVVFAIVVFRSVLYSAASGGTFKLRSRWMMLFDWFRGMTHFWSHKLFKMPYSEQSSISDACGPKTSFFMGMIHGIGAETGTQIVLITTIGGIKDAIFGYGTLAAFIVGMVVSNSVMAAAMCCGLISAAKIRPLFLTIGAGAACFSFAVGVYLLWGGLSPLLLRT